MRRVFNLLHLQWARRWNKARKRLWEFIREHQLTVASDMKRRYDKGRKPMHLEPGDLVLLSVASHAALGGIRKHRERYVGPYIVESRIHDNAYALKGLPPGVPTTQNVQYLRLFLPSPLKFASRPHPEYAKPLDVDGQTEWEVEKIVGHKEYQQTYRYRVKWKDTPQEQWLGERSLIHCKELLRTYHREQRLPMTPFLTSASDEDDAEASEAPTSSSDEENQAPNLPAFQTPSSTNPMSPPPSSIHVDSPTSSSNPPSVSVPLGSAPTNPLPSPSLQYDLTPTATPLQPLSSSTPRGSRSLRRWRREQRRERRISSVKATAPTSRPAAFLPSLLEDGEEEYLFYGNQQKLLAEERSPLQTPKEVFPPSASSRATSDTREESPGSEADAITLITEVSAQNDHT